MLSIENLYADVQGKAVLKGLNLEVKAGTVHAIMGPNGAGKSTLAYTLAGRAGYDVTAGSATLNGQDLLGLEPHARAAAGLFLAFQYPVELPGVPVMSFLKTAIESLAKGRGEPVPDTATILRRIKKVAATLGVKDEMLKRSVNVGFSGGEKKRFEAMQMAILEPRLAILDETDSGLDIDALKTVAEGVNSLRTPERSFVVITHYQRLLDYIKPDYVHVLDGGRITQTGGAELALELEASGYTGVKQQA